MITMAMTQAIRCWWLLLPIIQRNIRHRDLAFHLGGEEFCILLPGSGREEAHAVADVLRTGLAEQHLLVAGLPVTPTLSAGVATLGDDGKDIVHLYNMAGQRLYLAKHSGRNRVACQGAGGAGRFCCGRKCIVSGITGNAVILMCGLPLYGRDYLDIFIILIPFSH